MYLIVVDAYSIWPEVIRMSSSTSTSETTKVLLSLFSRHGQPDKFVSDNGPQFTSDEFKEFMTNCGILHIKTTPYHPQTNGEAERFVQTFKNFIKTKALIIKTMTKALINVRSTKPFLIF